MRVLLTSYAEKTHFLGMVSLGWALRTAGHEVRVATQPDFADVVVRTGLTVVPVGRDHFLYQQYEWSQRFADEEAPGFFDMDELWPADLTWEELKWGYREVVWWWWRTVNDPMVDDLVLFCRQWEPNLVIWEPGTFAGGLAAKACGAAHARLMWSADLFGRMRATFLSALKARAPEEHEDILAEWLEVHLAKFDGAFSEDLTCGQFTIDHMPASLGLDTGLNRVPLRYIPYNGPAVIPRWLRERPTHPRVCLSLGISATERLGGYAVSIQDLLDALGDLDIEIVATVPERQQAQLARVPANTRLASFVPLHALVPTCTLMINHGGPGTICTTARYGVPQLILPRRLLDDRLVARRLADQGAALVIPSEDVTADQVRDHVLQLLRDPGFHVSAERLRREMLAMPSPNEIVPDLERLTAVLRNGASATARYATKER